MKTISLFTATGAACSLLLCGNLHAVEATNVTILKPPTVNAEDINVVRVHRVSSPYYQTGNSFHSEGDPFNRDGTRMMLLELDSAAINAPARARGMVAGKITDLIAWKTFDEYRQAATPIFKTFKPKDTPDFSFHWSRHPGEENVVYALRKSRKMVVRINVDTHVEEDVVSYDPGDGRDESPRVCGWTTDNRLLVVMNERGATHGGGFEVDVLKRTRTAFAEWPQQGPPGPVKGRTQFSAAEYSDQWRRFQKNNLGSGHGGRSPSGRFAIVNSSYTPSQGVVDTMTGKYFFNDIRKGGDADNRCWPLIPNYCNWNASENWFLMNSSGEQAIGGKPTFGRKPEIQDFSIWQVHFLGDRNPADPFAYRKLLVVRSSCGWYDEQEKLRYMEGSRIHINVSRDARWLYFVATDGNYHEVDYQASLRSPEFGYVGTNWSTCGVFIAECAPANQ